MNIYAILTTFYTKIYVYIKRNGQIKLIQVDSVTWLTYKNLHKNEKIFIEKNCRMIEKAKIYTNPSKFAYFCIKWAYFLT